MLMQPPPTDEQVLRQLCTDWEVDPDDPDVRQHVQGTFAYQGRLLSARMQRLLYTVINPN